MIDPVHLSLWLASGVSGPVWWTQHGNRTCWMGLCMWKVCGRCSVPLINRGAIKGTGCPNWPVFLMYSIRSMPGHFQSLRSVIRKGCFDLQDMLEFHTSCQCSVTVRQSSKILGYEWLTCCVTT